MQGLKVVFYLKADKKKNGLCTIYGKISLADRAQLSPQADIFLKTGGSALTGC